MTRLLCSPTYRQRLLILLLVGAMVLLYVSIALAADALDPQMKELLQFYAKVVIGLISVIGGLITYIFQTGLKSVREILQKDINGIGTKVGDVEGRVTRVEGSIDTLQQALPNEYMRVKEHDRICPK